jgi:hypothetical protein
LSCAAPKTVTISTLDRVDPHHAARQIGVEFGIDCVRPNQWAVATHSTTALRAMIRFMRRIPTSCSHVSAAAASGQEGIVADFGEIPAEATKLRHRRFART